MKKLISLMALIAVTSSSFAATYRVDNNTDKPIKVEFIGKVYANKVNVPQRPASSSRPASYFYRDSGFVCTIRVTTEDGKVISESFKDKEGKPSCNQQKNKLVSFRIDNKSGKLMLGVQTEAVLE